MITQKPGTEYAGTLTERLHRAALAMPDVKKTGWNEHFRYAYIEDVELVTHAKQALLENGVLITQELVDVRQENGHTLAKWNFLITGPGLNGTPQSCSWYSEARDSGDKGISKCTTMARKDFLRTLLLVPGGGSDNEADVETDQLAAMKPLTVPTVPTLDQVLMKPASSAAKSTRPPSQKQLDYMNSLASQLIERGETPTYTEPHTSEEASLAIDEMTKQLRSGA